MEKGVLMVVSGFAGVGKGTVVRSLVQRYEGYALSVSATTRQPREGEVHGKAYFFLTDAQFEELLERDGLLEHAGYVGHYYGTPRAFVEENLAAGRNVILEIEMQGALQIRKKFPEAVLVFIMPPSMEVLKSRLIGRGTETPEQVKARLQRAKEESVGIEQYDYCLINDEVDACADQLQAIAVACRRRTGQNLEFIKQLQRQAQALEV